MNVELKKMAPEAPKHLLTNNLKLPKKGEKKEPKEHKWLTFITPAIFIIIIYISVLKIFSYYDVTSLCHIKIDGDILRGNKKAIKSSIVLLKKEDKPSYQTLCKYVDTISENFCYNCDQRGDAECKYVSQPACFIKGSKTIYLNPDKSNSGESINARAELLKKYADSSKNFWLNVKH